MQALGGKKGEDSSTKSPQKSEDSSKKSPQKSVSKRKQPKTPLAQMQLVPAENAAAAASVEVAGEAVQKKNLIMRLSLSRPSNMDNPCPYNKDETSVFNRIKSCTYSSIDPPSALEPSGDLATYAPAHPVASATDFSAPPPCHHPPLQTDPDMSRNIVRLLTDFEEKSKNGEWPLSTNVHCYWCCHQFPNAPIGLPVKLSVDCSRFLVIGCFCSLECACAFNFASKDNTDEILSRYSLLNDMAVRIGFTQRVRPAPDRLALTIFGGHLGIAEFRGFKKNERQLIITTPPMISITQQVEELHEHDSHSEYRYVPLDNERVSKFQEKIRLKRSKPLVNLKNTLEHSMKLVYTASSSSSQSIQKQD
jgi:hypothetical protein